MTLAELNKIASEEGLDPENVRLVMPLSDILFDVDLADAEEVEHLGLDVSKTFLLSLTLTPSTIDQKFGASPLGGNTRSEAF